MRRELGGVQTLGTFEMTVGASWPALVGNALRTQLQRVQQRDFERSIWIIAARRRADHAMLAMVAWMLAQRLERPIVELIRSAERIGEGDYTRPHKVTSNDEIADLEMALDRMRQKLRQTTITKNYLTTVLNSMNDAVLVTSPDGIVKRSTTRRCACSATTRKKSPASRSRRCSPRTSAPRSRWKRRRSKRARR